MTTIKSEDLVTSVADALQFISYYHPKDFIEAVHAAYTREQSPAAKDALAQILVNSRMCAEGRRPICQDTGIVTVFIRIGMDVRWDDGGMSVADMVNEGVRRAYTHPDNILRPSIMADPAGERTNTRDNTPAVIHMEVVPGDTVEVQLAAKGGGSENKAKMAMLNPSDNIADWVVDVVPTLGAGWCPPGILGIGIGGTAEKAVVLAKEALLEPIDIQVLKQRGARSRLDELRLEIYDRVNDLGIGAQGLGGLTTVLDVKIIDYPTHAASLPVGLIPNCAATRHAHFTLHGNGPARETAPGRDDWPEILEKVLAADILVIGTSIWLGEKTSVATRVVERLYSASHHLNAAGQYAYYGRVGGCLVTGNEDGAKHCAMNVLYSLQHLGYVIPPQADAAWLGEAGPGPSYLDEGSGGPENDFTNRNTTFMTWNLLHLARLIKDAGGIPAHGNQRSEWDAGCRFDHPNPLYR